MTIPRNSSVAPPGGLSRIRLALVLENLTRGGPAEGCLALLRGLDRQRFQPVVHSLHGGELERDIGQLRIDCHVGCREARLPNRKEQLRAEASQRLEWHRSLVEGLLADDVEAAIVWAVPGTVAVLQRAGVRVALDRVDAPAATCVAEDKSGFDRVVTGSREECQALGKRAAEFGLDPARIVCRPLTDDRLRDPPLDVTGTPPACDATHRLQVAAYERLVEECLAEKPAPAGSRHALCGGGTWPRGMVAGPARPRVLALVTRYKWTHTDYLVALGRHVDLRVVVTREVHAGAVANGRRWGLDLVELGPDPDTTSLEQGLEELVTVYRPDIIHCLYYYHESETALARRIAERTVPPEQRPRILFECRDPLTTLRPHQPARIEQERAALRAADGWVFVSEATRRHYERLHRLDLSEGLIVPHGLAERTVAPPSKKLSAIDGRLHLALVGSAVSKPDDGRYYPRIIRQLTAQGLVVHSHFHPDPAADPLHAALAKELPDYHAHPILPHREGTVMSQAMSAYDLMGVFHELEATGRNEVRTLEVCMPTKAICGWLSGGIPIVCFDVYRGLMEWIEAYGVGFAVAGLHEVGHLIGRRDEIFRATRRCLEHRHLFSHETQAFRLVAHYRAMMTRPQPRRDP